PPRSLLSPYTTLFRSSRASASSSPSSWWESTCSLTSCTPRSTHGSSTSDGDVRGGGGSRGGGDRESRAKPGRGGVAPPRRELGRGRKSTRLNSSHQII